MPQGNPKKSRPTGKLAAHRQRLREEAEARNAIAAGQSIEERIAIVKARPGNNARELARLKKALAARNAGGTKKKVGKGGRTGKDYIPTGRGH